MKRRPRPSLVTTTMPALATLLSQCSREPPRYAPNPPGVENNLPQQVHDAGVIAALPPTFIDPTNIPSMPLAGAPMPVTDLPPRPPPSPSPAPSPSPGAAMAPAPSAAPAPAPMLAAAAGPAAPTRPGVYIVHNHPPGTACRPISETELRQVMQRAGVAR